jgi:pantothenate kinase
MEKFLNDFQKFLNSGECCFPSFEHEIKDPVENSIFISKDDKIVIFEGLYLFINDLDIIRHFDATIYVDCDVDMAMQRVAKRNYEAGICETFEKSFERAMDSDKKNSEFILKNSKFEKNIFILENI